MKIKSNRLLRKSEYRQRGAAMFIVLAILASLAGIYVYTTVGGKEGAALDRQDKRIESLAEAKKALLSFAVNEFEAGDRYGGLPCPDIDETGINKEGVEHGNCGANGANSIGRLPWYSLGIKALRDHSGECLWYVVSGSYKNNVPEDMLNDDAYGRLNLYDAQGNMIQGAVPGSVAAEDRVVAMVIAPGTPLPGQSRSLVAGAETCGGNYDPVNYLEGNGVIDNSTLTGIADTLDEFIMGDATSAGSATPFNDLFLVITQGEIWQAVKRRSDYIPTMRTLTREVSQCLANYANTNPVPPGGGAVPNSTNNLPWASAIDLGDYRLDVSYSDVNNLGFGRLPDSVQNSENQLATNGFPATGFPPGPPAGVPPGPPTNVPPGGGGNCAVPPCGGGGGVGPGGGALPTSCADCEAAFEAAKAAAQAVYDQVTATADADYAICIAGRRNTTPCDSQLQNTMRDAQRDLDTAMQQAQDDYDACMAANSCSTGGGGTPTSCSDCQAIYDQSVTLAQQVLDAAIATANTAYTTCLAGSTPPGQCRQAQRDAVRIAQAVYDATFAAAATALDQCLALNGCTTTASPAKGITNVITSCLTGTNLQLWQDWKDHFFYAVSPTYEPDSANVACDGSCVTTTPEGGGASTEHAAIVMFAGQRTANQSRNGAVIAGDTETKNSVSNYLENNNDDGNTDYVNYGAGVDLLNPAYPAGFEKDYLYCIDEVAGNPAADLQVTECP